MKISAIKEKLKDQKELIIEQADGQLVPTHFHITEVGVIDKHFIDCGGTVRKEQKANFQLWSANDFNHRLHPEKLLSIIELSEKKLGMGDLEVEVEYQGNTIGKYGLNFERNRFVLQSMQTDCLAKDNCGIPAEKMKVNLADLDQSKQDEACCSGSNCC